MKTSAFSLYTGPGRISIARFAPRGTCAGYRVYAPWRPALGQKGQAVAAGSTKPASMPGYAAQLAALDPQQVWDRLHDLAGAGIEPVLLCWERPPFTARTVAIVALWRHGLSTSSATRSTR
jgi:hypothetical protein